MQKKLTVAERNKKALASIGFPGKKPCGCPEPQAPPPPAAERPKNTVE